MKNIGGGSAIVSYSEGGILFLAKDYAEQRDGGFFVKDTRVSLDSLVYAFLRRDCTEAIASSFPMLHLEHVFGALAFYMANRQMIRHHYAKVGIISKRCVKRLAIKIGSFIPSSQMHAILSDADELARKHCVFAN